MSDTILTVSEWETAISDAGPIYDSTALRQHDAALRQQVATLAADNAKVTNDLRMARVILDDSTAHTERTTAERDALREELAKAHRDYAKLAAHRVMENGELAEEVETLKRNIGAMRGQHEHAAAERERELAGAAECI